MSGLGIMQREILRRARGSFSVREIALRLYPTIDDTNLGAVRRAVRGLEASGYLVHEPLPRPQAALARVNAGRPVASRHRHCPSSRAIVRVTFRGRDLFEQSSERSKPCLPKTRLQSS
jgi:hypothetical protein